MGCSIAQDVFHVKTHQMDNISVFIIDSLGIGGDLWVFVWFFVPSTCGKLTGVDLLGGGILAGKSWHPHWIRCHDGLL